MLATSASMAVTTPRCRPVDSVGTDDREGSYAVFSSTPNGCRRRDGNEGDVTALDSGPKTHKNPIQHHHSKLRQHTAGRVAVGSRTEWTHRPRILERPAQKVGQQPESSARVGAKALGAPLSMRPRVRDTSRAYHGATRGAPWHVPTAVSGGALAAKRTSSQKGVLTKKYA